LAVSNIAWDVAEDEAIVGLLKRYGIDAIDVVPGKYFLRPATVTDSEIAQVQNWWATQGVEITGMQALLFGTAGLNLFGPSEVQEAMLHHLGAICRIGRGLGARRLVFGSPKNRDRGKLNDAEAMTMAVAFFRRLGDIAARDGVVICLEPNPECYGANFMTTSSETAQVVEQVAHPAIRLQFDTGSLAINGEDPVAVLRDCAQLVGHIHASEPNLLPLGTGRTQHFEAARALAGCLGGHVVSIEMLATGNEPHEVSIERALKVAIRYYRHDQIGADA
jgi:sugar phosphate isomerase/epimerase